MCRKSERTLTSPRGVSGRYSLTTLWEQAEQVAKLELRFAAWEERSQSFDPFDQYADQEDGTWKIDYGVSELEITGEPEQERLLNSHPAAESLPEIRAELLETRYMNYLEEMSEAVVSSFSTESPLAGKDAAYEWWTDNEQDLATGETVALFLIDALRLDPLESWPTPFEKTIRSPKRPELARFHRRPSSGWLRSPRGEPTGSVSNSGTGSYPSNEVASVPTTKEIE